MSDRSLRELERAWRSSGDPADEARLLTEGLRLGRLARARVELAAYLRHEPARLALGDGAPAGEHVPWRAWVASVDADGRRALVRALVGAVRAWRDPSGAGLASACEALEGWLAAPGAEASRLLREARDALRVDPIGPEALAPGTIERMVAAWCLREACLLVLAPGVDAVEGALRRVVQAARDDALPWLGADAGPAVDPLLAWALGPAHTLGRATPAPGGAGARDADPGRYLRERLRRGEVTLARLRLAAYAGDAAARAAAGDQAPAAPRDLEAWLHGLAAFDPALAARAVAGVAGHVLLRPITRAWLGAPSSGRGHAVRAGLVRQARDACEALRGWAERPAPAARQALARHAEGLAPGPMDRAAPGPRAQRALQALRAALAGACAPGGGVAADERWARAAALRALQEVVDAPADVDLLARGLVAGWAREA